MFSCGIHTVDGCGCVCVCCAVVLSIMWDFVVQYRLVVAFSFMTSSCKNDRERLWLHWTQFDYKTTHTHTHTHIQREHKTWLHSLNWTGGSLYCGLFCLENSKFAFQCDKHVLYCFLVGALKIVNLNRTVLMLAIKMDLFSKLMFPALPMKCVLIFILFCGSIIYIFMRKRPTDRSHKEQYHTIAMQSAHIVHIHCNWKIFSVCWH